MPNPHEIVAEIKRLLETGQVGPDKELADLAAGYAALCAAANARLRRCADFLRRSLRSEAIYHAEIEPDLLDLVGALDLPGLREWNALCAEHRVPPAPVLLLDVANELNQAYAAEEGSRGLMTKLRLLSLGRVPLGQRLAVLRSLAELDPANATLEKDVKTFEAARLREIAAEANRAFAAKDFDHLRRLAGEITDDSWRSPVPEELTLQVARQAGQVQVERATAELARLAEQLHAAHAALDPDECRRLLAEWRQILSASHMPAPADLQAQVQPIADWVAGLDRQRELARQFQAACAALRTGLDEAAPAADLQKLYRDISAFDRPVPPELEQVYNARLVELELIQRRRHRLLLAVGMAIVLLAGAAAAFLIHRGIVAAQAENCIRDVNAAVERGDWDRLAEIEKELKTDRPALARRGDVQEALRLARRRQAQDRQRAADFDRWMTQAEHAGVAEPDFEAVNRAEGLARTAKEKQRMLDFKGEISKYGQLQRKKALAAFRADAGNLMAVLPGLKQKLDKGSPGLERDLRRAEAELRNLRSRPKVADEDKNAELRPIELRLAGIRESWDKTEEARKQKQQEEMRRRKEQEKLERSLAAVADARSAAALKEALADFVREHPGSEKVAPFTRAAAQGAGWVGIEQWEGLVRQWQQRLAPEDVRKIPERIQEVNKYLAKHPQSPLRDRLEACIAYLGKTAEAMGETSPWRQDLAGVMTTPVMELRTFKTTDGKTFYTVKDARIQEDSLGRRVQVVLTSDTTKPVWRRADDLATPIQGSPQQKLAADVRGKLADFRMSSWETFGWDVAQMIRDARKVDPVLRAILLEIVLTYIKDTGWGAERDAGNMLDSLRPLGADKLAWMNPDSDDANNMRPKVSAALAKMKPFETVRDELRKKRSAMLQAARFACDRRGVAIRDAGGAWQVRTSAGALKDGLTLWVVGEAAGSAAPKLHRIGQVKDKKVALDAPAMAGAAEGTMVFFLKPAPE